MPQESYSNQALLHIKLSADTAPAEVAHEMLDAGNNVVMAKTNFTPALANEDGTGYNWKRLINNIGVKIKIYVRSSLYPAGEHTEIITRPSATTARTNIYTAP